MVGLLVFDKTRALGKTTLCVFFLKDWIIIYDRVPCNMRLVICLLQREKIHLFRNDLDEVNLVGPHGFQMMSQGENALNGERWVVTDYENITDKRTKQGRVDGLL
jgi:hypothetical protein